MSHKNTTLPGIRQVPALSESSRGSRDFDENTDMVPVPMDRELARIIPSDPAAFSENEHHYIKLHGSFNWMSTSGSNAVVIGYQQDKQIENEPLLDRYFDLFKKVLFLPNRKLMIIGYGFREPHINRVIADAVENKGLRVYVISPESPRQFVDNRIRRPHPFSGETVAHEDWQKIILGLSGYYPFRVMDALKKTEPNFDMFKDYFS